jgi:hypothetical protein
MTTMKRLLLLFVLGITCVVAFPVAADAKVPCRNAIFNDWYHDGQIASTYPLACYRDALAHVRNGDAIYTSLQDDIQSALQAAIQRQHGKKVAAQVGHKFAPAPTKPVLVNQKGGGKHSTKTIESVSPRSGDGPGGPQTLADVSSSSDGGGVPLPIIALGAVALALLAAGGLGLAVRSRRGPAS